MISVYIWFHDFSRSALRLPGPPEIFQVKLWVVCLPKAWYGGAKKRPKNMDPEKTKLVDRVKLGASGGVEL